MKLTGTMQARIQQLKDRSKCHIYMRTGHWKKECPRRDRSMGRSTAKGSGKSGEPNRTEGHESMVADYDPVITEDGSWMTREAHELSASHSEVFFSTETLQELETLIVSDAGPSNVQTGGTSGSMKFSSVITKHFLDRDSASDEAYMSEQPICGLATHAVPDTACRRTFVGEQVLEDMLTELKKHGRTVRYV